ncbi:hypothetical protein [Paenibacillus sp. FSL M7-0420]|uniref:hypothetical protein n=1 Tax=Paenibacillus sp. FSL M7-0420 TaxID=2921609 RepID=UPI0030FC03B7
MLNTVQKHQLIQDGYTILANAVPQEQVILAKKAINHSLGKGMTFREAVLGRALGYCSELNTSGNILELFYGSRAKSVIQEIFEDKYEDVVSGQIALRFSESLDHPSVIPAPHIDGLPSPYNGVTKENYNNFELLVGVFLSNVHEHFAGNLTVWPRSHQIIRDYFRIYGEDAVLNGMPEVDLGKPQQILVNEGDIIICNYLLAHSVSPNLSANIRYAVYFRIRHSERFSWRTTLTDPWWYWNNNCSEEKEDDHAL